MPDTAEDSGADGIRLIATVAACMWQRGWASRFVIRPDVWGPCIIPTPNGKVSNLTFGGPEHNVIFATCGGGGDKVYQRKVKVKGAPSFLPPHKPGNPRL